MGKLLLKKNNNGITVLKWKDERDILFLSSENSSEMVNTKTKQKFCRKLKMIVKYNIGKTAIDLSNKMSA